MAKAQSKDHLAALAKLTIEVDGELRFVESPPLLVPAESLFTDVYSKQSVDNLYDALTQYRHTLAGGPAAAVGEVRVRRPGPQGRRGG